MQTFFAPRFAFGSIYSEPKHVRGKACFIIDVVKESGITGRFRERAGVAADNGATAGLCFNHGPAEAFEARRIQ